MTVVEDIRTATEPPEEWSPQYEGLQFYAGAPIVVEDAGVGTAFIMDDEAHSGPLNEEILSHLADALATIRSMASPILTRLEPDLESRWPGTRARAAQLFGLLGGASCPGILRRRLADAEPAQRSNPFWTISTVSREWT